ncbi:MAG: ACP S-malonyltransferase [Alphaproteobacteria bacterium]|nr:MAG: ACP S-malonyltransferase [Alphaproteobacteria bacterium]
MSHVFLFPGQGSQSVGMGRDLAQAFPEARDVLDEVDEVLHQNLSRLMFEGPDEDLRLTENTQPALMAHSLAVVRVLEKQGGMKLHQRAAFVAGHSLGEYSALCSVGALSLADTACLLKTRGQAMQQAVPVGAGGMAAILGAEMDAVEALAREASQGEICSTANDNAPGQIVISGHKAAIERALVLAKAAGLRAMSLPVSAPFHCALMQPAAQVMQEALAKVTLQAPHLPVMANVTAALVDAPEEIRARLVEQVCGRVRWRESIQNLAAMGATGYTELGSGSVLAGLVKRIQPQAARDSLAGPRDIERFLTPSQEQP